MKLTEREKVLAEADPRFLELFAKREERRARKPMPSLATRAKNAAKAAGRIVKAAVTGGQILAPKSLVDARKATCDACPERDRKGVCRECGCQLSSKRRLLTETCPLGKWPTPATPPADPSSAASSQPSGPAGSSLD